MSEVSFKWNNQAFRAIRYGDSDPRVRMALENMAADMADRANDFLGERGYFIASRPGRPAPYGRWQVLVYTGTTHAKRSDAVHNTLRRVMGA